MDEDVDELFKEMMAKTDPKRGLLSLQMMQTQPQISDALLKAIYTLTPTPPYSTLPTTLKMASLALHYIIMTKRMLDDPALVPLAKSLKKLGADLYASHPNDTSEGHDDETPDSGFGFKEAT
jgi:hypothetical protein